jgi:hypothetical protein
MDDDGRRHLLDGDAKFCSQFARQASSCIGNNGDHISSLDGATVELLPGATFARIA